MSRNKLKKDRNERREELLRPNPYLGYDRDKLGMYFLSRRACKTAESQLRRAVWLNFYECHFVCHLAWCLYKQGRYEEAKKFIEGVDAKYADEDKEMRMIIERIKQEIQISTQ